LRPFTAQRFWTLHHRRHMARFLVLAAGLATAGCSGVLNPDGRFSFSATSPEMGGNPPFAAVTGVAQAGFQFAGSITTPTPCYRIGGAADVREGTVTITVSATSTLDSNRMCVQALGVSDYQGAVRELTPGAYRVVVIHTIPNTGSPVQTVADTAIVVP
jgi:hypothetical protein